MVQILRNRQPSLNKVHTVNALRSHDLAHCVCKRGDLHGPWGATWDGGAIASQAMAPVARRRLQQGAHSQRSKIPWPHTLRLQKRRPPWSMGRQLRWRCNSEPSHGASGSAPPTLMRGRRLYGERSRTCLPRCTSGSGCCAPARPLPCALAQSFTKEQVLQLKADENCWQRWLASLQEQVDKIGLGSDQRWMGGSPAGWVRDWRG
jgi:hypothetical protein